MTETSQRSKKELEPRLTQVDFVRHAPKDRLTGLLLPEGILEAEDIGNTLGPVFYTRVWSSNSARAQETAQLVSQQKPEVAGEISYPYAAKELSRELNDRALDLERYPDGPVEFVIPMLEAFANPSSEENLGLEEEIINFRDAIEKQARTLNQFIDRLVQNSAPGSRLLIVGHDITGVVAMLLRQKGPDWHLTDITDDDIQGFEPLCGFSVTDPDSSEEYTVTPISLSELANQNQ